MHHKSGALEKWCATEEPKKKVWCVTLVLKFSRRSVFMNSKISSGFLAIRRWSKRFCMGRDPKNSKSLKNLEVYLPDDSEYSTCSSPDLLIEILSILRVFEERPAWSTVRAKRGTCSVIYCPSEARNRQRGPLHHAFGAPCRARQDLVYKTHCFRPL